MGQQYQYDETIPLISFIWQNKEDFPMTYSEPISQYITNHESDVVENFYKHAAVSFQGRNQLEDSFVANPGNFQAKDSFFAVFDG